MLCAGLSTASSTTPLTLNIVTSTHDDSSHAESMRQVRQATASIAQRCLKHRDQFCGIRAQTDSTGIKAGIWRPRFESVRCAALLLAFRKTNENMQAHPVCPGQLCCYLHVYADHHVDCDNLMSMLTVMLTVNMTHSAEC